MGACAGVSVHGASWLWPASRRPSDRGRGMACLVLMLAHEGPARSACDFDIFFECVWDKDPTAVKPLDGRIVVGSMYHVAV